MEKIKNWFKNNAINNGERYIFFEQKGYLDVTTEEIVFMIAEPSKTKNRWRLRVATFMTELFVMEEFFETDIELCNYLYEHQLDIYKNSLKCLSKDYNKIYNQYSQLKLQNWEKFRKQSGNMSS